MDASNYSLQKIKISERFYTSDALFVGIIIIFSVAVNLPFFSKSYYPIHDTLTVFHFFSHFYSEIMSSHAIPSWLPYTAYGIPIESYILFSFGPFQYLTLLIGFLFHIENTLTLFIISLTLDTIFLGVCTYLFCKQILENNFVSVICATIVVLLAQYDQQLYWNFKILLPIPLSLYFAQKLVDSLNPVFFLGIIATLLTWSFGSLPYVFPFQFYVIACYAAILILKTYNVANLNRTSINLVYQQSIKQIQDNFLIFIVILSIIIISVTMLAYTKNVMMHDMAYSTSFGRNANYSVSKHVYLHHGGYLGFDKIIEMINGHPYSNNAFLPFVGIICIAFAIYSIFDKQKTNSHIALIITTVFVLMFSVADTKVAVIAYYLPKMNIFRHIAYVITIGKMLLIILSGFGIRAYLRKK